MKRILILDDDQGFRRILSDALKATGFESAEAGNAGEAETILHAHPPDCIVMDGLLPDVDGPSWIQRLRAGGSNIPVIFASAFWKDHGTAQRMTAELGILAVHRKPVSPESLVRDVVRFFQFPGVDPPAPTGTENIEDQLALLRREYAQVLPARVSEMEMAFRAVERAESSAADTFRMLAHRLRGTAGSYGFEEIGDVAGFCEETILRYRAGEPDAAATLEGLRKDVARLATLARSSVAEAPSAVPEAGRPMDRILVVDDDPAALTYMQEMARRLAIEIVPARSAQAAVEAAQFQVPDAAIVDVGLQGHETGFDLTRRLREIPRCGALPFAFISGRDSVETRVAAVHAGGSVFLKKPVDAGTLPDVLQQLLSQRSVKPRVMLIDDDPGFHQRVETILGRKGMDVLSLRQTGDLLAQLDRFRPHLLLLDILMPDVDGLDICRILRTAPAWRDLPILFLTSQISMETRIAAFRAGADDYLVKPIVAEELEARVEVRLERMRLLQEQAERDALTGALLRRPFVSRLTECLAEAQRKEYGVSLCLIDVDHFKHVNDTYGHLAGDRVLSMIGRLLATRFRAGDIRARWGGEEFMLCFPGESISVAAAIVNRLLEEVRQMAFESDDGASFKVTFSAGIASFPAEGTTTQELTRVADRRLYLAKNGGRNRVVNAG